MYLFIYIIDLTVILILLRLLIRPNEAFFNQIFSLLYRITDPLLVPAGYIMRDDRKKIFITVLCLVLIRALLYMTKPMPFITGAGISFMSLFQLLYKFYMVIWFISVITKQGYGSSFMDILQRAFKPVSTTAQKFGISMRHFSVFSFLFLWVIYSLLSFIIHYFISVGVTFSSFSIVQSFGEGLIIFIGLFPGFFSLIIIAAALLSWVSPDPYNPIVQAIYGISEPMLNPFRRIIPNLGGLDVSPIAALLCFQILGRFGQQLIVGIMRAF